jgi:carboxypeptidase C (cathepsin A)
MPRLTVLSFCWFLACTALVVADDDAKSKSDDAKKTTKPADEKPESGAYRGKVTINGEEIEFRGRVTAMTIARNESDKEATVYYTEYLRTGVEDKAARPITFCFNGGPGSASLWLHIGGLSPRRIDLQPDELNPNAWELLPNEWSIIDQTDLVFIDPVSTGFSRPEKKDEKGEFHGYANDIESVAEFIRAWTAANGRWSSPQYILGESYGGIRGAALAGHLRSEHNYSIEGIIFVSPVIDFQTIRFAESNDLPYIVFLPSYTATAYHHGKIDAAKYPTLDDALAAAEKFALGDYATALLQGDRLPKKQRRQIVAKLSEFTGLSAEYLEQADLRVSMSRFGKELLREEGRIIGRFDGRFSSPGWDGTNSSTEFDPSSSFIGGYFVEAIQQYYFDSFRLRKSLPYAASGDVQPWDYSRFEGRFANASDALRETMTQQPNMRVLFCLGRTDLATPYLGSLHTISHLDVAPAIRKNIQTTFYDAGHMMYLRKSEQEKLKQDLDAFYAGDQPQ